MSTNLSAAKLRYLRMVRDGKNPHDDPTARANFHNSAQIFGGRTRTRHDLESMGLIERDVWPPRLTEEGRVALEREDAK